MTENNHNLRDQLCFSFYNTNRLFNQFYKKSLKKFNLTYTQYIVLLSLWEEDQQYLNHLGRQLELESNTLTPLLKRLEEKELIRRERPKEDTRQLVISLTLKGKDLEKQVENELMHCFSNFSILKPDKVKEMINDNNKLADELRKLVE